jgi:hypothetical protein
MERRNFITAVSALGTIGLAGCLSGTDDTGTQQEQDDLSVDVEFQVTDGDLVVQHAGGDVLESGEEVYVIVEGDQVAEATISEDVRVGGEIIRAENINREYYGENFVGLYANQGSESVELGSTELSIPSPTPASQLWFDYNASETELIVSHDGGESITPENTGELRWGGSNAGDMSFNNSEAYIEADGTVTGNIQADDQIGSSSNMPSDGSIELIWVGPAGEMTITLGEWEGPGA